MYPKDLIRKQLGGLAGPDYDRSDEPHGMLARIPFPLYLTTNFDDFLTAALQHHHRNPRREVCHWNGSPAMRDQPNLPAKFEPTVANPLVFHLHGHFGIPESLVLTEDDYLDFLVAVSRNGKILPHQVQKALAGTSLLFIGYRLADWSFRVLHRGLVMTSEPSLRRLSLTVQLPTEAPESEKRYVEAYFSAMNVRVYWGDAGQFVTELRERWKQFERDG